MPRRIVGALKTPADNAQIGQLRFVAVGKNNSFQLDSESKTITLGAAGEYDLSLQDGAYHVQFNPLKKFIDLGFIEVANGVDISLPSLLAS